MNISQENNQSPKANLTREIREAAMNEIQENQRFSRNPLTEKQMRAMRNTLNQDWEKAQKQEQLASRYGEMLDVLYKRVHFLTHHLLLWEEQGERDRKWQIAFEDKLNGFMNGATQILQTISEQAHEIIEGIPKSQGEMLGLIMGTLNELRDKVSNLENSFRTSEVSKKCTKARGWTGPDQSDR